MGQALNQLERDVQSAGMDLLRAYGWDVHRRNTGAMKLEYKGKPRWVAFSTPGASDVWALKNGLHLEVEFKRPKERPSPEQVQWMLRINSSGAVALWVDNLGTLERVLPWIERGMRVAMRDNGDWDLIA